MDIKCPICGAKTTLRTSKQDGSKFHICINYPDCRGKVAYDDEWEEEQPVSRTTQQRTPQRTMRTKSSSRRRLKYTQSAKFYCLITFIIATVIGVAVCWGQWKPEVDIASRLGYCLGYSMPIGLVVAIIVYCIAKALGR
jgi:hypothetical protein